MTEADILRQLESERHGGFCSLRRSEDGKTLTIVRHGRTPIVFQAASEFRAGPYASGYLFTEVRSAGTGRSIDSQLQDLLKHMRKGV